MIRRLVLVGLLAIAGAATSQAQETGGSFGGADFGAGAPTTSPPSGGGGGGPAPSPFEELDRREREDRERERRERRRREREQRALDAPLAPAPVEPGSRSVPIWRDPILCVIPCILGIIALPILGIIAGLRRSRVRDD